MTKEFFSLVKYQLANVVRAKWMLAYALFFFFFTNALLMFGGDSSKAAASILTITLLIVPMISILYATIYWYNSESFTSLLLTQPLRRSSLFLSNWLSISLGLSGSFAFSTILALLLNHSLDRSSLTVLISGGVLTFIFVALGLLTAVAIADRMKGVGVAFVLWLYFSILHDALVFAVVSVLKDYPIEIPTMFLMAINPIDLVRVQVLLTLDLAAMMGYTGKILQDILSGSWGLTLTMGALILWILLPLLVGLRVFFRKDL